MSFIRLLCIVCISATLVSFLLISGSLFGFKEEVKSFKMATKRILSTKYQNTFCTLPRYDPWDPKVMKYVDLYYADNFKCKEFKMLTSLSNGSLWRLSEDYKCRGRCVTRKDDYTNKHGPWISSFAKFDCDFVEAECSTLNNDTEVVYSALHTQVVPSKISSNSSSDKIKPSVFVLLVDSMSWSQSHRNLPKTMHFFKNAMGAIDFPFVNKVGLNSKPNGFALWFGKLMEEVDRSVFGLPPMKSEISWNESCYNYLDNDTSVFDEYRRSGYKGGDWIDDRDLGFRMAQTSDADDSIQTFAADDWSRGTITWPNCLGYKNQPVDHIFQPFTLEVENNEDLTKNYREAFCRTMINEELDYLQQFIDAYKDQPRFAWFWTSLLSHDYTETSIRLDTDLYSFLVKNREVFDKSYVILMGDHGLRYGYITKTKLGATDVNNPLLSIAVPKHLRETYITERMRENSKSLQTHFDTRITLLDILYTENSDFQAPAFEKEHGQSLLREQHGERSCRTLPIPFEYCICEMNEKVMNTSLPISISVGQAVIHSVNEILQKNNVTNKCPLWKFSKVISISSITPQLNSTSYIITASVNEPYNKAQFRATVNQMRNDSLSVGSVDRVDSYGKRGNCVEGSLWRLCDCKT